MDDLRDKGIDWDGDTTIQWSIDRPDDGPDSVHTFVGPFKWRDIIRDGLTIAGPDFADVLLLFISKFPGAVGLRALFHHLMIVPRPEAAATDGNFIAFKRRNPDEFITTGALDFKRAENVTHDHLLKKRDKKIKPKLSAAFQDGVHLRDDGCRRFSGK